MNLFQDAGQRLGPLLVLQCVLAVAGCDCVGTEKQLIGGPSATEGSLRVDFDLNLDGQINEKDRMIADSEFFVLGVNNADHDDDGEVDWRNRKVEDFTALREFKVRRCRISPGPSSLYLTARSVPVQLAPDTMLDTIGQVRIFDDTAHELLPPGESVALKLPRRYVRRLASHDLPLFIEGVHGFDAEVGVELRTPDGVVCASNYQRVSMIGPTAAKLTTRTDLTPYRALECFEGINTLVVDDFAVAERLIHVIIQQEKWDKPRPELPRSPLAAAAAAARFFANKQYFIVGGHPDSIDTRRVVTRYALLMLDHADAYAIKAERDPGVSTHMHTLVQYLATSEVKRPDVERMLRFAWLVERVTSKPMPQTTATALGTLKGHCRDSLGLFRYVAMWLRK